MFGAFARSCGRSPYSIGLRTRVALRARPTLLTPAAAGLARRIIAASLVWVARIVLGLGQGRAKAERKQGKRQEEFFHRYLSRPPTRETSPQCLRSWAGAHHHVYFATLTGDAQGLRARVALRAVRTLRTSVAAAGLARRIIAASLVCVTRTLGQGRAKAERKQGKRQEDFSHGWRHDIISFSGRSTQVLQLVDNYHHGCNRDGWCLEVVDIDYSPDITSFRAPSGALPFLVGTTDPAAKRATLRICRLLRWRDSNFRRARDRSSRSCFAYFAEVTAKKTTAALGLLLSRHLQVAVLPTSPRISTHLPCICATILVKFFVLVNR
jgi:hypothetical protein